MDLCRARARPRKRDRVPALPARSISSHSLHPQSWNSKTRPSTGAPTTTRTTATSSAIRANWTVTDSAPGRPTSITSSDGTLLRVEAIANTTVADEAAAHAFVESDAQRYQRASASSQSPVIRVRASPLPTAYTTVDGAKQSGLSVLLNAPDGNLHIANLLFPADSVDLNTIQIGTPSSTEAVAQATAEAVAEAIAEATAVSDPRTQNLALVMSTFYVITPLNLSAQSLPPTPTPLPTLAPTVEATVEATAEATAEMTIEPTAEATSAATPEMTVEPTTEPTVQATTEVTAESTAAQ